MHSHHYHQQHHHRRKKHSSSNIPSSNSSSSSSLSFHQPGFDVKSDAAIVDEYEYQNASEEYEAALRKTKKPVTNSYYDQENSRIDQDPALYSPSLSYSSVSSGRSSLNSDSSKRRNVLDELSEEELKKKMYKKYKDKGVIGLLKTQLRSMIYEDLTKKSPTHKDPSITVFGNRPEIQRACVSLFS